MNVCGCIERTWKGTRLIDRVLTHGTCNLPLICGKCSQKIAINLAFFRPECEACSPLFTNEFFSDKLDIEKAAFDGFVYHAGGVRVEDLLTESPSFENVDYYFEAENIFAELKILKTEFGQTPEHLAKFERLMIEWLEAGRLTEAQCIGIEPPPPEFVTAHMQILRNPIQRISNKANNQIKQTKEALSMPDAKGLVIYMIDGFYQADPYLTVSLIGDPLTRHMSSIDGYVVLSLRKKIRMDGDSLERFFWEKRCRDANDDRLHEFVDKFGEKWFDYLEQISGTKFVDRIENTDVNDGRFSTAKFSGG